jgi:PAS domain S-box-containing protein
MLMLGKLRGAPKAGDYTLSYDHQRLLTLINNLSDGIMALDASMNVVLANGAALNVLNVNAVKDHPITELMKLVDNSGNNVDIASLIASSRPGFTSDDYKISYPDGSYSHLYLSISPVQSTYSSGESWGFVVIVRDITTDKLKDEARDEFIDVVGHELLAPIASAQDGVAKALAMVKDIGASEMAVNSVQNAYDQVMFLSALTNDLSVLSRADRGKLAMSVQKFSLAELLQELSTSYTPKASAKNIKLNFVLEPEVTEISSSRLYINEILQNMITNALNYTVNGTVNVTISKVADGVGFSVSDTGIGISQADQSKLFSKFFRSEDSRVKSLNGTGLGLYICHKLIELMGGRIGLQSELNRGTTFKFYLPNLPATN